MQPRRQRAWQKDTGVEDDSQAEMPPLQSSREYASLIIEATLTAALLSLHEIRAMFEELWAAEGEHLSYFDE